MASSSGGTVTIKVKPGVKVDVQEVEQLEGDREFVAEASQGLKVAIQQVPAAASTTAAASKVTMCG